MEVDVAALDATADWMVCRGTVKLLFLLYFDPYTKLYQGSVKFLELEV